MLVISGSASRAVADEASAPMPAEAAEGLAGLDAAAAVREGNKLLKDGDAAAALRAYGHARQLDPAAPQIDFVEGLAYYTQGDYERARAAFEDAAAAADGQLVDDAIYSVGTTYHAQALQADADPQQAIAQLENAMQRYQTVLGSRPENPAAREANYKAASMWRTLKEQLQQEQQQQQDQSQDQQEGEQQEEQKQPQPSEQEGEEPPQEQNQQQAESADDQQEQDQQQAEGQQEQPQPDQQAEQEPSDEAQAAQEEQVSRDDAERKLRQLMQALRDREKRRPERQEPVRLVPVDKDW